MPSRHVPPSKLAACCVVFAAVAFGAWNALAGGAGSERTSAQQLIAQLQAPASASASGSAAPPSKALDAARKALDRAERARASGDEANAALLEGLALEWAELARDSSRAAAAEADAGAAQASATKARTELARARSLLEAQLTRKARAEGEFQHLQQSADGGVVAPAASAMLASPSPSSLPEKRARRAGSPAGAASSTPGDAP